MFLPRIDVDGFLDTVANAPLIAFQKVQYGLAVAAPANFAFYAPVAHPGGGNLPEDFANKLGVSCVNRICNAKLRTLRPTEKPLMTTPLIRHIESNFGHVDPETGFDKVAGDHPAMIEFQTQVVIQAIEERDRPELQATMKGLKREAMLEACERVQEHASWALEALEEGKGPKVTLHLVQCSSALKFALELMLKP